MEPSSARWHGRSGRLKTGVGVVVAVVAEDEVVGGAADGDGLGGAVVADLRAHVLLGEGVGGVHVLVAEQAELGRVGLAVEHRRLLAAEVARRYSLPRRRRRL